MITFYDNGGATCDRYTMNVRANNGFDVYAFSDNAESPQGFNQFCGTQDMESDNGKQINFDDLPPEVQKSVIGRLTF